MKAKKKRKKGERGNEKENDESEMQVICEILKLSGGSKCKGVSSFEQEPSKNFLKLMILLKLLNF
jgi:hypothetical protein